MEEYRRLENGMEAVYSMYVHDSLQAVGVMEEGGCNHF